ncbi:MAG: TM1812 family CRISPR-associated protein [Candidatus Aenigmatarchaeota archaeon]
MILQVIGYLAPYNEVNYRIQDSLYKTPFSSHALQQHFGEEVLIFAPKSLIEEYYENDPKLLEDKIREKKNNFDHFELAIIPSIGEYEFKDRKVEYKNNFDNIVIAILLHLLKKNPERVLMDVSTGQNVYVFALIEAVRRYATYRQLEKILQGSDFIPRIATYQPILRNIKEVKIEIGDFPTRPFFSLPQADPDKLCKTGDREVKREAGEIGKKYHTLKSAFRLLQKEVTIGFNAVRYNTPLAFYELLKFDANADEIEIGFSKLAHEFLENEIPMDLKVFSNILFSIAMFRSFREFKSTLNMPSINEIGLKFQRVYTKADLDVNCNFLTRELEEIKTRAEKRRMEIEQKRRVSLLELYKKETCEGDEKFGSKDIKRNFFAHSGFLKEYTFVTIANGDFCLEWDKSKHKDIENWLLNP